MKKKIEKSLWDKDWTDFGHFKFYKYLITTDNNTNNGN